MKQFVCWVLMSLLAVSMKAQMSICISTEKTTGLVFPFSILHVDRGTQAILAQQVKEAPGILFVKAGEKDFSETNLSVVTSDGSLYSFTVCFDNNPRSLVYNLPVKTTASIYTYANNIVDNPKTLQGVHDSKWEIETSVEGIYIKNEVMYFQLSIGNNSPVDYDIDVLRLFIRDRKKAKRTAVQETDLKPIYKAGDISQVKAGTTSTMVFAVDKFTIPDAKYMGIQIMERNGGRHLSMKLGNKKLMQAITLPNLR